MDNTQLNIESLSIGYKTPLVENISCGLFSGKFCALLGANGSGKSTLLNTINGTKLPQKGRILFNQKSSITISDKNLAKTLSIVSTYTNFAQDLTVYDIVSFGRTPYIGLFSKLSQTDKNLIKKYLSKLNLEKLAANRFDQLSDGQKQRVMICRALVQNTPLVLLDEPTAHLDAEQRIKIFQLLKQVCKEENKIVICSTHEIENALEFSDKLWLIDKQKNFISGDTTGFSKEKVLELLF